MQCSCSIPVLLEGELTVIALPLTLGLSGVVGGQGTVLSLGTILLRPWAWQHLSGSWLAVSESESELPRVLRQR